MALKGTTRIELTNVKTGEKEVIEKTNMVTNAVNDILSLNPGGVLFDNYSKGTVGELESFAETFFPICPNLIGGILMYADPLEEDPDKYFANQSNVVVGYSSNDVNAGTDVKRGSMNQTESGPLDDGSGYRFVFDFETSQANGTISALGLTSPFGGVHGYGSTLSATDEYRKPLLQVFDYSVQYSGNYIEEERARAFVNIVSIDPENNVGYFAYVNAENSVVVGTMRLDLTAVGLCRNFPSGAEVLSTAMITTTNFAKVMYTSKRFYGTMIDGGDGYIWGFQHSENTAGNSSGDATVLWIKINKADWTFEEGTWIIAAQLMPFGEVGDFSSVSTQQTHAVIYDGKLYALKNEGKYISTIYEIPLDNVTDVKMYTSKSRWSTSVTANQAGTILNVINGRVNTKYQYIDGDALGQRHIRGEGVNTTPSQKMCTSDCSKPGLTYGPFIFAFSTYVNSGANHNYTYEAYVYLQMCFLATINNLPTPVQKTADKTMKITYILREE